jgi:hypothetical protein
MDSKKSYVVDNKFVCGTKSMDIVNGVEFEKDPLKYGIQLMPKKYTKLSTGPHDVVPKFYFAIDLAMCLCLVPMEEIQTETQMETEPKTKSETIERLETYMSNIFIQIIFPIRVYKQTQTLTEEKIITELIIPPNTTVFLGENGKRRANKVFVVKNTIQHTHKNINAAYSLFEEFFSYEMGEIVHPDHFSITYKTCGSGIHFYSEKNNAKNFKMLVRR